MAHRRTQLRRLDQLVIGARPDRLREQTEILAATVSPLTDEEQRRLHELNYRHKQPNARPLTAHELLERHRLSGRAVASRRRF